MRGPDGLHDERSQSEQQRPRTNREQPGTQNRSRPDHQDGNRNRGRSQNAAHVIGVAKSNQVGHEDQLPVGAGGVRIVSPAHHEPGDRREPGQRDRVHLLTNDRLVPDGERRCAHDGG